MTSFIEALQVYTFLQYALAAGILASVAAGVIGTYVVTRRISYIAGSIAHCVLGGMGAARYLSTVYGWQWITPLRGAIVAALLAAIIIGVVSLLAKQREDTVIGAVWAIGMAVGVLFIAKTPGYQQDLMGYLFGNILTVSANDLALIVLLDIIVVGVGLIFYNQLLAMSFDEEYARLRGIHVELYFLVLLCLTALTTVLLVSVVGIVLVIALLTLPAAIAGHFSKSLWQMMALAVVCSMLVTTGGLAISYAPDLPAGATIVLLAGGLYLLVAGATKLFSGRAR